MWKQMFLVPLLLLLVVHNIDAGFGDIGKFIKKANKLWESKKCSTTNWCVHKHADTSWVDCDLDGFPDAVCTDAWGRFGYISSKDNCKGKWPLTQAKPCGAVCRRRQTWCNDPAVFDYKDCDGDGIPDPTCSYQGKFWVIKSSQGCRSFSNAKCSAIDSATRDEVLRWAPQVRLHKNEEFKPSSVDFFLQNVNLRGGSSPGALRQSNLPACNDKCNLQSKESLGGASGTRPGFLKGQTGDVPVYAIVEDKGNGAKEITYWTFYPYNRGKRVCIGVFWNNHCPCAEVFGNCLCPRLNGCMGGYSTFGHHVGDWERVRVRLQNGQPQWYYLWIHDSGVTNKYGGAFNWNGREFTKRGITLQNAGGHPIVYAADGSHGIWPNPGKHTYKNLGVDTLSDYTGDGGTYWNTWNNVKIVKYDKNRQYSGEFQFLEFKGRWGNKEDGCNNPVSKISGECILANGPFGPPK